MKPCVPFSQQTPICSVFCSLHCFREWCCELIQVKMIGRVIYILESKRLEKSLCSEKHSREDLVLSLWDCVLWCATDVMQRCSGLPAGWVFSRRQEILLTSTRALLLLSMSILSFHPQFLFFPFFLKQNIYFNWRMITLQYWDGFCRTSVWISHRYTCVHSILNSPPTSFPDLSL